MIQPQGVDVSVEAFAIGMVVVAGAAVVLGVGALVVVSLGALVVVVLGGRLVEVVGSAMAELLVVVTEAGSVVELAVGRDTLGSPDPLDPHPAPTRAAVARSPAMAAPRRGPLLSGILTSVRLGGPRIGTNMPHRPLRIQG